MEKKVEGKYRKKRRSSLAEHQPRGREINKNVCLGENFFVFNDARPRVAVPKNQH